ncbi:YdcF family protein [Carboxylicivirga marina]|uniref:YdcF family protein n=1 Tax=Carboxylicivirga marina TaxID=2800988 RepID=A0ABS1HNN9_9BACT|nr:YdcF family protein [Carboxylicivirga marina]MBK3519060.1 YdcF family protein [Carboxylicivirga marina]
MFFLLSKILSFLLVPFNWCLLLLSFGLISKNKRKKRTAFIGCIFIFIIFSNTFIYQMVVKRWEYPVEPLTKDESIDYPIIILGGLSSYDNHTERIHFNEATDRLMQGLLLHKANPVRPLIISGGSAEIYFSERPEAKYLYGYLTNIGIESHKIHFETTSRNTFENALNTATLFDSLDIGKEITLVSSAFHMRRAQACFEKQNFKVHPLAAHAFTNHQALKPKDYLLPSLHTLQSWPLLIKEWMGILVYKLKGYL